MTIDYPCPICDAAPGEVCIDMNTRRELDTPHASRPETCAECERLQELPPGERLEKCEGCA